MIGSMDLLKVQNDTTSALAVVSCQDTAELNHTSDTMAFVALFDTQA